MSIIDMIVFLMSVISSIGGSPLTPFHFLSTKAGRRGCNTLVAFLGFWFASCSLIQLGKAIRSQMSVKISSGRGAWVSHPRKSQIMGESWTVRTKER